MTSQKIQHGVSRFYGPTLGGWFAWARRDGAPKKEGPNRLFKWRARLDARRLVRELR